MRLAVIKDGFFGFLAQVFDSWAEFLRLRIRARVEGEPVTGERDPFVSSPPEHWLELTADLSFTDWGHSEEAEDETGELPASTGLPEIPASPEVNGEIIGEKTGTPTADIPEKKAAKTKVPEMKVSQNPKVIETTKLPGTVKAASPGTDDTDATDAFAKPAGSTVSSESFVSPVSSGASSGSSESAASFVPSGSPAPFVSPESPVLSASSVPSVKKPAPPEGSNFVGKRLARPDEVNFVSRKIRNTEKPASFLSFSEERSALEAAKAAPKFVSPGNPSGQAPAEFLKAEGSRHSNEQAFVPDSAHEKISFAKNNFPKIDMGKSAVSLNSGNIVSQRQAAAVAEAENSFVKKEPAVPTISTVFTEPQFASEPLEAYFAKTGSPGSQISAAQVSAGEKFGRGSVESVPASFSQKPADLSPQVPFADHAGQPRFKEVGLKEPGMKDNIFFPVSVQKPVSGFRPQEKTVVKPEVKPDVKPPEVKDSSPRDGFSGRSKWAALPELDLNKPAETPEAAGLRMRHLALLEREQKGERWSV